MADSDKTETDLTHDEHVAEPRRPSRLIRLGESARSSMDVKRTRTLAARVIWTIFVLLALVLAVAALMIALDANPDNDLVDFVLETARNVDLGIFDLDNPIKEFGGDNADTKNALFNYGIGAVAYLIIGRLLERIVRA